MPRPGIDITVTGDEEGARRLMAIGERNQDMAPIFGVLSDDWDHIVAEQFETQGTRGGRRWHSLSDSWKAYKARHDLDPRIMFATHHLIKSLTVRNAPDSVRRITHDQLLRGTSVEYAEVHHTGGGRMPQRRLYVFTNRDRAAWEIVIQDYIISGAVRPPARWGGF
jgi:phage gpG-like protein